MNKWGRIAPPVVMMLMSACSQAQTLTAQPVPADAAAVRLDEGVTGGVSASLSLSVPSYQLQTLPGVHRWVAADITEYDVALKVKDASSTFVDLPTPLTAVVPVTGGVAPKAVFQNLQQGQFYQAVVTAKHNSSVINAHTATTADFDFTGTQDVNATLNRSVTVVLDGVDFNGTGNLSFATPGDGAYNQPSAAPTMLVSAPPAPGSTLATGSLPSGYQPNAVALDAQGNLWVGSDSGNMGVAEFSPTGSLLGVFSSFTFGGTHYPDQLAVDSGGNLWMNNDDPTSSQVRKLTSTGTLAVNVGSGLGNQTSGIAVDASDNVWVSSASSPYQLTQLSSTGAVLHTFTLSGGATGLAVDASSHVWVPQSGKLVVYGASGVVNAYTVAGATQMSNPVIDHAGNVWVLNGTTKVIEVSSAGVVLGSFAVPTGSAHVAVDANDHMWVTQRTGSTLTELTTAGVVVGTYTLGTSTSGPAGVVVDSAAGHVWVALHNNNTVVQLQN